MYHQPDNESFIGKHEQVQYNAALAITGAIKCFSRSKHKEKDVESLESRKGFGVYGIIHSLRSQNFPKS